MKKKIQLSIIVFFLLNISIWAQDQQQHAMPLNELTLGLSLGTGFFQNMQLNLINFQEEILKTSDNLVPTNIKAHFSYYFTPKIAVRFSSGYSFAKQTDKEKIDYGEIDSLNLKLADKSDFIMNGFPIETTLLFQTPLDKNENTLLHFGIGIGYYSYNYKAEGIYKELYSDTDDTKWKEEYNNPEITLSGWAQFFVMGFDINLSNDFGASFEISKIGLSFINIKNDVVLQKVYDHEIEYEIKYGYQQYDYKKKSGLEDVALSLGIYWRL